MVLFRWTGRGRNRGVLRLISGLDELNLPPEIDGVNRNVEALAVPGVNSRSMTTGSTYGSPRCAK